MLYFEPQKGKAFDALPDKTLRDFHSTKYVVSTKYDGNQIFIRKSEDTVRFFTSDWKEFELPALAKEVSNAPGDFVIVGEFMNACQGKLGDRKNSAVLTTYRTAFNKRMPGPNDYLVGRTNIKAFDYLPINNNKIVNTRIPYITRLEMMPIFNSNISTIDYTIMTGRNAIDYTRDLISVGWEGSMLVEPDSHYHIGKRVNHSIKLKFRKTVDLLCIGIEPGKGKYDGMIGAVILQDTHGRVVSVGSGLNDYLRSMPARDFIGNIIEIEYEQILDTYIQPTFIQIRHDKKVSD